MKYETELLGKTIRQERNKLNWTQKKLGDKIGVTGKQISNYEHGELLPPLDILEKMCKEFNCELGYLLGEEDYSEGTKLHTIIYDLYGLTPASLQAIKNITGNQGYISHSCLKKILRFLDEHTAPGHILGALFTSVLYFQILTSNSAGVNAITLLPEKSLTFLVII